MEKSGGAAWWSSKWCVLVAFVIVAVGLSIWGILAPWGWGTVPEWAAAIGTVGTLVAIVYTNRRDRQRQFDLDRRQLDQDREAHARLFDLWPEFAQTELGGRLLIRFALSNLSPAVMRGVDVAFEWQGVQLSPLYNVGRVPPNAPGQSIRKEAVVASERLPEMTGWDSELILGGITINTSFVDSTGNRWHRTAKGELRHLYNLNDPAGEPGAGVGVAG